MGYTADHLAALAMAQDDVLDDAEHHSEGATARHVHFADCAANVYDSSPVELDHEMDEEEYARRSGRFRTRTWRPATAVAAATEVRVRKRTADKGSSSHSVRPNAKGQDLANTQDPDASEDQG